ncbi:hypothetical protein LF1_29390 [Rubripirellula obstinata]|uniref:Uncharacterized protein n=1 Tax=Rubripirellula obstinata TaxID=406547 RepID=A0A5B1CKY0_9BACT|nr:hypothetical protein LF1_29390 [Rubripirellula obstinata]
MVRCQFLPNAGPKEDRAPSFCPLIVLPKSLAIRKSLTRYDGIELVEHQVHQHASDRHVHPNRIGVSD